MDKAYVGLALILTKYFLRRLAVINFADFIKVLSIFIKTIDKDSLKFKRILKKYIKMQFLSVFGNTKNCFFLVKSDNFSKSQEVCLLIYTHFTSVLGNVQLHQVLSL